MVRTRSLGLKLRPDFFIRLPDRECLARREADDGRIGLVNVFLDHDHMILVQKDRAELAACLKLNQLRHELTPALATRPLHCRPIDQIATSRQTLVNQRWFFSLA